MPYSNSNSKLTSSVEEETSLGELCRSLLVPYLSKMVFPKFALFYFPDSDVVRVDTDIIRSEHRREENLINSKEQLASEDGYIEVCMPS